MEAPYVNRRRIFPSAPDLRQFSPAGRKSTSLCQSGIISMFALQQ
jgi:hypothetical protein